MRLQQLRPMLAVTDLKRTMDFYCTKLGFKVEGTFGDPEPVWSQLARDGVSIMFNAPPRECVERDVPRKSKDYQIFYINVDDVVGTHGALKRSGLAVSDLRVMPYKMKEFDLRDPDGYWLMFAQETSEPPTTVTE